MAALADLAILDTQAEREFDAITRIAASMLGVRSAAVSLIDSHRQWFKSRHRIDLTETPRDVAFCDRVVTRRGPLVVRDTLDNEAFCRNPLVLHGPRIRFYAGVPLYLPSGDCIGSLCVLDPQPRPDFAAENIDLLSQLASVVEELIAARKDRAQSDIAAKVVASTPDAVLATNRSAEIVYWNQAAERMFDWPIEKAFGQNVEHIIPQRFHEEYQDFFATAAEAGPRKPAGQFIESKARRHDGSEFPVEVSLARWGNDANEGFAAVVRDITERRALQAERDSSRKFLDEVVNNLPSMLFVKDAETCRYLLLNRKAEQMIGRTAESMIGKRDSELFPSQGAWFTRNDLRVIASKGPERTESAFERDDGTLVNIRTTRVLVDGPERTGQYLLGLSEDVTEIRRAEAERWKLTRYDLLTGLLNRTSFLEQVNQLIADGARFAILNIDLDRFRSVNDQFGHFAGDEVLTELGKRLGALSDSETLVARTEGDKFVCLLIGDDVRDRARRISAQLFQSIHEPVFARGITAHIGASIGVVVHPDDGDNFETLRQHADLAMYRARLEKKGEPCFFDAQMDAAERDRRLLETHLRAAVESESIEVAFQPIVEVSTDAVTSMEALARWTDPDRGPVSPDVFISLAEDCGLIDAVGEQVLRRACREAVNWPEEIRLAVNLSPRQFFSGKLVHTVLSVLQETGLPASRLLLEVTENLVIQNAEEAFSQLERLKEEGIQISIDDFGIGYSSLSYFQNFNFDKVKIDKSFIAEIEGSRAAKAIVTAVVGLADQLSLSVVAEGVETVAQQELLRSLGVTHLQGYLFSPPIPAAQLRSRFSAFAEYKGTPPLRMPCPQLAS
ncbi:MAG: EAL domain-containing protein [Erythrobacter sp.]